MNKALRLAAVFLCLYNLGALPLVRAQYVHDPSKHYKVDEMEFDMELRGSYNISHCVSDNLNCWEAVKPDLICREGVHYPSACDVFLEYCHDLVEGFDQTDYLYAMQVHEMWCTSWEGYSK